MNTVQKMKAALAGEITVRTWWGCSGLSGKLSAPGSWIASWRRSTATTTGDGGA